MANQDWIGAGILGASLVLLAFLLRLRFIKSNPLLMLAVIANPGIVGCLAGGFFWTLDRHPASTYLGFAALFTTLFSTIAIMIFMPKAYLAQMREHIREQGIDPDTGDPLSNDGPDLQIEESTIQNDLQG